MKTRLAALFGFLLLTTFAGSAFAEATEAPSAPRAFSAGEPVVDPPRSEPALGVDPGPAPVEEVEGLSLMLLFAFLGGLILNVMPCVLPVLSIKVLGIVAHAEDDRRTILAHGLAYTAGILVSFAVLGALVVALKSSGELVGWGFQFQNPMFVAGMGALVFAFGLSLFGVFELEAPGASALGEKAGGHGYGPSFLNGVLATVLATPCTAPFLAPALGFALAQPAGVLFLFLLTIGFGLAAPFLVLAMFPGWAHRLPRPGPWMVTFKKAMGFLLVGTTVWLVDVLSEQVDRASVVGYLAFLAGLGFAAWVYGHWGALHRPVRMRWLATIAGPALVVAFGVAFLSFERPERRMPGEAVAVGEISWSDFASTDVEKLAQSGRTVFIDFTASWCVTCKVYERTVIDTDPVKAAFRQGCIETVKADYTNEDPKITTWLQRFRRPGVPMYVILPAGRPAEPILLPDLLTEGVLLDGLQKAGPTKEGSCPS